jgi:Transposase DDE domain group 1
MVRVSTPSSTTWARVVSKRTQSDPPTGEAHVEDRMKQFMACGARNLPSIDYGRNTAWLQLAALATTLTAWLRHSALDGDLATAATKTLRFSILSAPARLVTHARRRTLKFPPDWTWSNDLATAWNLLQALHPA